MAKPKKVKIYYNVQEGSISPDQIKSFYKKQGCHVNVNEYKARPGFGVINVNKEEEKQQVLSLGKEVSIEGMQVSILEKDPGKTPKQTDPVVSSLAVGSNEKREPKENFFNPYHFVNIREYTPKYAYTPHDSFAGHNGRITVELKFKTPGFIGDSNSTKYIISKDTLQEEDGPENTKFEETIQKFLSQKTNTNLPLPIFFDPDCRNWSAVNYQKHIKLNNQGNDLSLAKGILKKSKNNTGSKYYIETDEHITCSHRIMDFFERNGQPAIPGSTLKGLLRNIVENLSNSCFPGYDAERDTEYLFHRLDISKELQRKEAVQLKPVVLIKDAEDWKYVEVDQSKVLSEHLFNRIDGGEEENSLAGYFNTEGSFYEKISIRGKNESGKKTGIFAYHEKKSRGRIDPVISVKPCDESFSIEKINSQSLSHPDNKLNKTFPYVGIKSVGKMWAIIRKLRKGNFSTFKIKKISKNLDQLKKELNSFIKTSDSNKREVSYSVSEIRIKKSFDIDTKTQHRAFFVFGEEDFNSAVGNKKLEKLTKKQVDQFRSLLRQRKENSEKIAVDSQGINKSISQDMHDEIYNGMLAFFHRKEGYLTYTTVPQKPYKKDPKSILDRLGKLSCSSIEKLCPACNLFGSANLEPELNSQESIKKTVGYKGKVSLRCANIISTPKDPRMNYVTVKALGAPKPTYYPFYIINNRDDKMNSHNFVDYDHGAINIGRKTYLHHDPKMLDYKDKRQTRFNATIRPVPEGTAFQFQIDFTNLNTYELGLLIYSLEAEYNGQRLRQHIGMGKSLGLGSCELTLKEIELIDIIERYASLEAGSGVKKLEKSEIINFITSYKYAQSANNENDFVQRMNELNSVTPSNDMIENFSQIDSEFFDKQHIYEFHFLNVLNVNAPYMLGLPIVYAAGIEKGFEWYQKAKQDTSQRLFSPKALEEALINSQSMKAYALSQK
ncbi:TIGR03986 family type III CRISPR-associated RAMP protein [Desulfonatronovibrio magnus]|uniref:TIGR03986 family type III CRISPR-associated RAMP protein n=1 Tax=Desulfonatronovibrio magnus TaxID=698827 RepID=UPI0005EBA27E|nr:TIGR03986 family CRISPR-associated RAMP protein [Desulfonatronovibrio magnus]